MTEQMRVSDNVIYVEGTVTENNLQLKEKDGNEYIVGYVEIETEPDNKHRLTSYATKYKKDPKDRKKFSKDLSALFTGLSTVKDGYSVGDRVRVTQGQFGSNDYVANGELRSFPQLSTNFFNRLKDADDFNPQARFSLDVFVKNVKEEDSEEKNKRAIVEGYVVTFGGQLAPFKGFVPAGKNADYVMNNFDAGETINFSGNIVNYSKTIQQPIEVDFGEPQIEYKTQSVREYIITGGKKLKDAKQFDTDDMKKAVQARKEYLEGLKNKASNNSVPEGFSEDRSSKKGDPFEDEKKNKKQSKNDGFEW